MIYRYLQTRLTTKLIALAVVLALSAVISWRFSFNVPLVLGGIAAIALVVHFSLTYLNSALTTVVILVQIGLTLALTEGFNYYFYSASDLLNLNLTLIRTLFLAVGLFVVVFYAFFAYYFAKGRIWINLMVSFILFNGVAVPLLALREASVPIALLSAFGAALLYMVARSFRLKKNNPILPKSGIPAPLKKKANEILGNANLTVRDLSDTDVWRASHYLAHDDYNIYNIHVAPVRSKFLISSNGVFADDKNLNETLENLRLDVLRNKDETSVRKTTSVLLLPADSLLPQGIKTLNISRRKQPDRSAGLIVVSSPKRFQKLVKKQATGRKISEKDLKKLDF